MTPGAANAVAMYVTPPMTGGDRPVPVLVEATVAAVPRNLNELAGSADAGQGAIALAVEVPPAYVGIVGEAEVVSVGVLDGTAPFPDEQVTPRTAQQASGAATRGATRTTTAAAAAQPTANLDGPTTIPSPGPTTTGTPE